MTAGVSFAVAATDGAPPQALWLAGVYHDRYRKQPDGRWQISRMALDTRLMAPYEIGWAHQRVVGVGPSVWTDATDV